MRGMKVPKNLNRLPLLGVVELVLPRELKKIKLQKMRSNTGLFVFPRL